MIKPAGTADSAYPAIRFLIEKLGEKHTFLMGAEQYKQTFSPATALSDDLRSGRALPVIAELDGGIGVMRLPDLQGPPAITTAYRNRLRDAIAGFQQKGICRFIVDLRDNGGGNMWPMLSGILPLLGHPPFGTFIDKGRRTVWHLSGEEVTEKAIAEAGDARNNVAIGSAAVAVLIDGETVSSGEFTAIGLKGAPHVRFFGQPTAGYLTTNAGEALPDGALLVISRGYSTDRNGREYRDRVEPDVLTPSGQPTFDAASAWLKDQSCGTGQ
jgi:C-terminal processing protease CtpA/Prc